MITEEITYEDLNGQMRTEKFQFHLDTLEIQAINEELPDGLKATMRRISNLEDIGQYPEAAALATEILQLVFKYGYGEKSEDGRRFIKTTPDGRKLFDEFKECVAYNALFMTLIEDSDRSTKFINNVLSSSLKKQMAEVEKQLELNSNGKNKIEFPVQK